MIYYEILSNGDIGQSTNDINVAKELNLTLTTDKEIIYGCDGKRYIQGTEPTQPEPSYAELRMEAYPSLREQLDMIYWDKVNSTNLWQEKITEIKAKFPKK